MNNYNNHNSEIKDITRYYMIKLLEKVINNKFLNIFSLPSSNFNFENDAANLLNIKKQKFNFDTIERDKSTYKKGIKNINKILKPNCNFYEKNLEDFQFEKNYDFVWLDLCSNLNTKIFNLFNGNLKSLNLNDQAFFTITLTKNREKSKDLLKHLDIKNNISIQKIRDIKFPEFVCKELNLNFQGYIDYIDSYDKKSSPMRIYIFKNSKDKIEKPFKINLNKNKI